MDQGVISSMKRHYRAGLLRTLANEDDNLIAFWKEITVLDAIYGVTQAWSNVKPVTLAQSWKKIFLNQEEDLSGSNEEDASEVSDIMDLMTNLEGFKNVDKENLNESLQSDSCEPEFQYMSDADIITSAGNQSQEEESEEEINKHISHSTVLPCVDTLLEYMSQWDFEYNDIIAVRKIRTDIRKHLRFS